MMKLRDIVNQIEIDSRKLVEYVLNPENKGGTDKAILFEKRDREEIEVKPNLFDAVELLVVLPEDGRQAGERGAIVEDFGDAYEVEFTNAQGETLALCRLTPDQFMVVWQADSKP